MHLVGFTIETRYVGSCNDTDISEGRAASIFSVHRIAFG